MVAGVLVAGVLYFSNKGSLGKGFTRYNMFLVFLMFDIWVNLL